MTEFIVGLIGSFLPRRMLIALALVVVLVMGTVLLWPSKQASAADIRTYTGIALCPTARVKDLTMPQERDTTPGFSFHVQVALEGTCAADFERQVLSMSSGACGHARLGPEGCFVQDAYRYAGKHTSLTVKPLVLGQYDVRFYE